MSFLNTEYTVSAVADILSTSKSVIEKKIKNGQIFLNPVTNKIPHSSVCTYEPFMDFENSMWEKEVQVVPKRDFKLIELFAGAGGLSIGLERAGLKGVLFNEIDKHAAATLRYNRPDWNVINDDIANVDFKPYRDTIDVLTGGFPCQAFSYAGKSLGFNDIRGTLFFEMARAIKESNPKIFMAENVKALEKHDNGKTLATIKAVIKELGYTIVEPKVLKAIFYRVPQKRERLIIVAIRDDLLNQVSFTYPSVYHKIYTLHDAFYPSDLFDCKVPQSIGQNYSQRKAEIMSHVKQGGYWRNLPDELQKEYMKGSYFLGGGKTGMARRLSLNEPSLTLTCSPSQKQTERCHPIENRPLTVREYARVQTFTDDWIFCGPLTSQYKQIGNAVPVNLAEALGRALVKSLNMID